MEKVFILITPMPAVVALAVKVSVYNFFHNGKYKEVDFNRINLLFFGKVLKYLSTNEK